MKEYIYADITESLFFSETDKKMDQEFIYPNGMKGKVRSIDIIKSPFIQKQVHTIDKVFYKNLKQSILVFGFTLVISFIYFSIRGKFQFKKKIERGSYIASLKEIKKLIKKNNLFSDFFLDDLPFPKGTETSHTLITGTTGSGKTNCFHTLLPQIRNRGDRAIIVDMTGDLVAKYYNRDTDILLNPYDLRSFEWDIWQELGNDAQFDAFAEACVPPSNLSNDRFWDQAGSKILSTALKKIKREKVPSITKLYEILVSSPLEDYHKFFEGTEAAAFTDKKADKTTLSIRSTLVNQISFFKLLINQTSPSSNCLSIRKWVEDNSSTNGWVFLSARADQRNSLRPYISALVDTAINSLMTLIPDPNRRLWFVLDELPSLQKLPSLEMGLAELRKYGGCILAGVQSIPQFSAVYGRAHAQAMLDLFNTKIFFRNTDPDTTHWISRVLGETELMEAQENLSYGANTIRDGVSLSNITRTKPIVLPTEIASLKNLECYVKIPGSYPATKINMVYKKLADINKSFVMREDRDFSFKESLTIKGESEEGFLVMDM